MDRLMKKVAIVTGGARGIGGGHVTAVRSGRGADRDRRSARRYWADFVTGAHLRSDGGLAIA
jgi:hypothetical protein